MTIVCVCACVHVCVYLSVSQSQWVWPEPDNYFHIVATRIKKWIIESLRHTEKLTFLSLSALKLLGNTVSSPLAGKDMGLNYNKEEHSNSRKVVVTQDPTKTADFLSQLSIKKQIGCLTCLLWWWSFRCQYHGIASRDQHIAIPLGSPPWMRQAETERVSCLMWGLVGNRTSRMSALPALQFRILCSALNLKEAEAERRVKPTWND